MASSGIGGGTGNADEYMDITLLMENQLMENLIVEKHMDILLETASKDCWQCYSKMMPSSKQACLRTAGHFPKLLVG